MADHLARIEQLAHDIGVAERPLTKSEIAVAMLQSMPPDYTVMVQVIQGADKGTDPVYVYNKLVDEEQTRNSEKPQSGSNDESDKALNASHHINKSGEHESVSNAIAPVTLQGIVDQKAKILKTTSNTFRAFGAFRALLGNIHIVCHGDE